MFVHLLNADQLKTLQMYIKKSNYQVCLKDLKAIILLASINKPPNAKGAPGK